MPRINHRDLKKITKEILKKTGSNEKEAQIVAEHLVLSNLCGHDSHGVGMIPSYLEHISQGILRPNKSVKMVKDDGAILVFDGQLGYGQRTAKEAMEMSIARCRDNGLVVMALRNAHHIGRVGTYGEQSIKEGMVSLHFVNVIGHKPVVAPYGGTDARYSTNPVCMAMPGTEETEPILLDMATSKIAMGKAREAMTAGKSVSDSQLLDHTGNPTKDPSVMFQDPIGALLPFGFYKGYGIALFCEMLAGVLTGGGTTLPKTQTRGGIINNMLVFLLDPKRLVDHSWMKKEIDDMVRYVKESPPRDPQDPVMVAGDPERKSLDERKRDGIPFNDQAWENILAAANSVGISRSEIQRIVS